MSLVIARAPFRVSLLGGSSDYPAWYRDHDGACLTGSIDKYCYVTARFMPPFYPNGYKVVWKHIEQVTSIGEILHPTVRAALKAMGFTDRRGVELTYHGDLPANTGMGSSSSFAVGLLHALSVLRGDKPWTASLLAASAIYLEQTAMKETVGCQDQIAAAHGGLNLVRFPAGGTEFPLESLPGDALQARLMLFYTGQTRLGADLAAQTVAAMPSQPEAIQRLAQLALMGAEALRAGEPDAVGAMMHEAWSIKRGLAEGISTNRIDGFYAKAKSAGALGGKLLGAGGAGFMLFYVPLDWQDSVKDALRDLIHVPFRFEYEGSKIILNGDGA